MPQEMTVMTYHYDELADSSGGRSPRQRARDWWLEQVADIHTTDVHLHFMERLVACGYPTERVEFSLNYCQGDGVAFYTGRLRNENARLRWPHCSANCEPYVNLRRLWLRRLLPQFDKDVRRRLYGYVHRGLTVDVGINPNSYGSHYSHYNTMDVVVDFDYDSSRFSEAEKNQIDRDSEDLRLAILEDVRDLSRELADEGYRMFSDLASDAQVREGLEANDQLFFADGSPFHG